MFNQVTLNNLASSADDINAGGNKYLQGLPSPCRSVCQMDAASGVCLGCLRTLPEIAAWGQADEALKRQIWAAIAARVRTRLAVADDALDAAH